MKESMQDGLNMRTSTVFFLFAALQFILLGLITANTISRKVAVIPQLAEKRAMVRESGLSDLSPFTEARYRRHPTLADQHSSSQDGPSSSVPFPSGTMADQPPLLASGDHD